jgi:hypothetical protein
MKIVSLDQLAEKTFTTFLRFPLAIVAAFIGSLFFIMAVHLNGASYSSHYYYWNIVMTSYLGMLLFISLKVFIEQRKLSRKTAFLLLILAIGLLVCYYFSLPARFMTISFTRFCLLALILHLTIAFIPYLEKDMINGFWQYNKIIFLRILLSALYTIVLYLGLVIAMLAMEKLFNADISSNTYFDLWIWLAGVFNTWFFLSGFPSKFSELDLQNDYPKGLKIFTQFILLPLISIYLIILYAYMFKIIVTAQWPSGWVSYLVIGFSIGGILSLLLIYPIRNHENNKWILIFSRFFYFALFPLIVLLFFAIKRRISDYGVTELRYFILVLALWLLFVAFYFLFSKAKNIKVIPISLCLLALASSFGPWGAFSVSLASQKNHLKALLNKYSMLVNGRIEPSKDTIPFKDNKKISSTINYLVDVHGYKSLQPYFVRNLDSALKNENRYDYTEKIHSMINLKYIQDYQIQEDNSENKYLTFFSNNSSNIVSVEGYNYFIQDFSINEYAKENTTCNTYLVGKNNISFCFDFEKKQLLVFSENKKDSAVSFDIESLVNSLEKGYSNYSSVPPELMTLISGNSALKVKIIFNNIHFYKRESSKERIGMNGNIFIREQ